jgi:hypothetical protein
MNGRKQARAENNFSARTEGGISGRKKLFSWHLEIFWRRCRSHKMTFYVLRNHANIDPFNSCHLSSHNHRRHCNFTFPCLRFFGHDLSALMRNPQSWVTAQWPGEVLCFFVNGVRLYQLALKILRKSISIQNIIVLSAYVNYRQNDDYNGSTIYYHLSLISSF